MDYYIYKNDQNVGPLSESEVISGLKSGRFSSNDLACRVGEDKWQSIDVFFPNIAHSWMENAGTSQANSYNSSTQTALNSNYGNSEQPAFQNPMQPYAQPAYVQHVVHHYEEEAEGSLPMISMVGGIVVACLMVIGLIPCFGWVNWFVLLLGGVTKVVCWVAIFTGGNSKGRNKAVIGLVLVVLALIIGSIRLAVGSGCF